MLHASLHLFDSARLSARYSIGLRITPKPANYPSISAAPRGSAPYVMTTPPRQGLLCSVVLRETSSVKKGYHSPLKTGQMVTEAQTLHPFSPRRKALRPDKFGDLPAVGSWFPNVQVPSSDNRDRSRARRLRRLLWCRDTLNTRRRLQLRSDDPSAFAFSPRPLPLVIQRPERRSTVLCEALLNPIVPYD